MTYKEWFINHGKKHSKIVSKLSNLSDEEIIDYFDFDNMREKEEDFCPLYKKNKKCHDMDNLNCYMCACPYFRFDDNGIFRDGKNIVKSICSINAKESSTITHDGVTHLNCSNCLLPHKKSFIAKNFSRDWFEMMKNCIKDSNE